MHHSGGGLSPGAVGGIVIGAFFGVFLLFLLCIFCLRARRRNAYYVDDESSEDSRRRRPRPVDPYGGRGMTFVGGGNQRETKVVITKSQRMFVRPPPAKRERIETYRKERMVVVDEDED